MGCTDRKGERSNKYEQDDNLPFFRPIELTRNALADAG
jgi:hypothetical protein